MKDWPLNTAGTNSRKMLYTLVIFAPLAGCSEPSVPVPVNHAADNLKVHMGSFVSYPGTDYYVSTVGACSGGRFVAGDGSIMIRCEYTRSTPVSRDKYTVFCDTTPNGKCYEKIGKSPRQLPD